MPCPVADNRQPGKECGGVGTCVNDECKCLAGYDGQDCGSCDPAFFSVLAPEWGKSSSKCAITDSTTSFIGLKPSPVGSGSGQSESPASPASNHSALTPQFLIIGAIVFMSVLVVMVVSIYYIRRRKGRPTYPVPEWHVGLSVKQTSTLDDNESLASYHSTPMSTPYYSTRHNDQISLSPNRLSQQNSRSTKMAWNAVEKERDDQTAPRGFQRMPTTGSGQHGSSRGNAYRASLYTAEDDDNDDDYGMGY